MENLAGRPHCDAVIEKELRRAKIEIVKIEEKHREEVPFTIIGILGDFKFVRLWAYYEVRGPMPSNMAHRLYHDPVGRTDIRVDGDAGCRGPENASELNAAFCGLEPKKGYVYKYHVDSEVGLRILADAIRELGIAGHDQQFTPKEVADYHGGPVAGHIRDVVKAGKGWHVLLDLLKNFQEKDFMVFDLGVGQAAFQLLISMSLTRPGPVPITLDGDATFWHRIGEEIKEIARKRLVEIKEEEENARNT